MVDSGEFHQWLCLRKLNGELLQHTLSNLNNTLLVILMVNCRVVLHKTLNGGHKHTDLIIMDFAKAFNKVQHRRLLH